MLVKSLNVAVSLLFLAMAAVQVNDPDPAYWVSVYLLVALVPHRQLLGRYFQRTVFIAGGMVLSGLLMAVAGFVDYVLSQDYGSITGPMSPDKGYVESAREFIGLLFCVLCLVVYWNVRATPKL